MPPASSMAWRVTSVVSSSCTPEMISGVQLVQPALRPAQALQAQRVFVLVAIEHDQVAQVVKHQRLVGTIDHVRLVGLAPRGDVHFHADPRHRQAQRLVDRPHDLRVAFHQVVVGGDDVHRKASHGDCGGGQRRRQRLAFACMHFGHHALQHGPAAQQLHIEMRLAQRQPTRLADQREGTCGALLRDDIGEQVE
ncbi:hypothetical protein G6F57_019806 [Rhizopus arrhizus]|nr:hypothetical protein G6F57_019806 [Rhizopus arrhizus]